MTTTPEQRAAVIAKLEEVITAVESHEKWTPPEPDNGLYHVWDFVKRSQYMLSEYDNIKAGKALKYPDQFRPKPGTGVKAADAMAEDVFGRSTMISLIVGDTSGKSAMMIGSNIDFGPVIKGKVEELVVASR